MAGIELKFTTDGKAHSARYTDVVSLCHDKALRAMFCDGLVEEATLWLDGRRLAGVPVPTWERLIDALASNGAILIRHAANR